jgi:thiamine-monophosphate kinase
VTGEFVAIGRLARHLPPQTVNGVSRGEVWIGDDAAVLRTPTRPWTVLAADAVVDGVHADLRLTTLQDLGWKALTCNLSDVAAMGADPGHALVTVAGPAGTDLEALYEGLGSAATIYGCPVVGGDLTNAPVLVVSVAVTGTADGPPVLRSGGRAGDGIWVTGPLGASAAGLRLLRGGSGRAPVAPEDMALVDAHARPVPRLAEGRAARAAGATAMIDVSDGLGADLGHLADASGIGFELDEVPVAAGATRAEALAGGEDYELVFTAADPARVVDAFASLRRPTQIGRCVGDPQRRVIGTEQLLAWGWQHRW